MYTIFYEDDILPFVDDLYTEICRLHNTSSTKVALIHSDIENIFPFTGAEIVIFLQILIQHYLCYGVHVYMCCVLGRGFVMRPN
jgi:hypothetical protein